MKIAFYKGRGRWFDRLVKWWTRGPYSHCELVLADGMCVSSSPRDGGVRFADIDLTTGRWDVFEIDADESHAAAWFASRIGAPYDWLGLFGFVWRPFIGSGAGWFCSEACAAALRIPDPWRFCPNTLAAIIKPAPSGLFHACKEAP